MILAAFLLAAHGIAAVVLMAVVLPLFVQVCLLCLLLVSAWHQIRVAWLKDHRAVSRFELHDDGRISVLRSGQWLEARVAPDCYVTRWLMILRLRGRGVPSALILAADGLAAEDHRRLRLWLRHRL